MTMGEEYLMHLWEWQRGLSKEALRELIGAIIAMSVLHVHCSLRDEEWSSDAKISFL